MTRIQSNPFWGSPAHRAFLRAMRLPEFRHQQRITLLSTAVDHAPTYAHAYVQRSIAYAGKRQAAAARTDVRAVRAISSSYASLAAGITESLALAYQGLFPSALSHIDRHINLHFGNYFLLFYRGRILEMMGDTTTAFVDYTHAAEAGKKFRHHDAHYRLSLLENRADNVENALHHIQTALDYADANADYYLFQAELHQRLGQYARALTSLDAALQAEPLHRQARDLRLHILASPYG